jgi:hypothetical protein
VRLLTLLGIIIMLSTPLIHASHFSTDNMEKNAFADQMLLIKNNTTIGVAGYRTNYYLNDNITIPVGRSLTFLDLNVFVQISTGNITDFGCLRIVNSSIHMYSSNQSLVTNVLGSVNPANLTVENSSWSIPGMISMSHSVDRISNSTFSSGFTVPADEAETLSVLIVNSSFTGYNSTFAGLMHTSPVAPEDTANISYSRDVPFSSDGIIPLSDHVLTGTDPLVTRVEVNLTFSGNNPTGENSLNFTYSGNFESFRLADTGSVHNESSSTFNLTLSSKLAPLNSLENNFSVSMYVANTLGSNSSIESLNISLFSNDTVSLYGLRYFSYDIYNSTVTFARSSLMIDMNNPDLYDNVMNPAHDFLFSVNSSIYILGSEIDGSQGTYSFYFEHSSTILLYAYVRVTAITGSLNDSNFPLVITPLTCATYVSSMNRFAYGALSALNVNEGKISNYSYGYYLLTDFIMGPAKTYTGNYEFGIYNFTDQVALPDYNYSSLNLLNETLHINLPILSFQLMTEDLVMGASNNVALNVSLEGCESMQISINGIIRLGKTQLLTIFNKTETIKSGVNIVSASDLYIPYLSGKNVSLNILAHTSVPTYSGENLTYTFDIPLLLNLMLNTTYSYTWLHNEDKLMLSLNYSLHTGPFNYTFYAMASVTTLSGQLTENRSGLVNESDPEGSLDILFNLTALVVNATLMITISNNSFLLENGSDTLHFRIEGNSSFYPESTLDIQVEGLPDYTTWTIAIGNSSYSSSGTVLTVKLSNGIYNYSFLQIPGYITNMSNGVIIAINKEEYLNVSFSQFTYPVMIIETGLQDNSSWSVRMSNRTNYANTSSIVLYLPNGTYNFTANSPGFKTLNVSYGIFISGSGVLIHVAFVKTKHTSTLITLLKEVYGDPFFYILTAILLIVYSRFYRGSIRVCSTCLNPIPRGRFRCQQCKSPDKDGKNE